MIGFNRSYSRWFVAISALSPESFVESFQ